MRVIGGSSENQMIVVEDRKRQSGSEGTFGELSIIGDRTGNSTIFNEGVRGLRPCTDRVYAPGTFLFCEA